MLEKAGNLMTFKCYSPQKQLVPTDEKIQLHIHICFGNAKR